MLYAGLDLGSKRTRVHVRDGEGNALYGGWAHDLGELKKILGRWGSELSVALEATTGAFFVHDELQGLVGEVKVAHPRDLRAIAHARIKNDRLDAEKLSELNRGDLIPRVWVPSVKSRDERELILEHARMRRAIRTEKVKIYAVLRRWGRRGAVAKPFTKEGLKQLMELKLAAGAQAVLAIKIGHLGQLREAEQKLQREIRKQIPMGDREQWLATIPGIGAHSARWLSNVLGDVSRFPDGRHVSSYFGLVPSERTSCTEPRRGRITKEGNVWLRWLLIQCAWAAIRSTKKDATGYWSGMYDELVTRGKSKKRAIVALANRLARVAYAVLRDQRPYEARERRTKKEETPGGSQKIHVLKTTRSTPP
jgi:transposase